MSPASSSWEEMTSSSTEVGLLLPPRERSIPQAIATPNLLGPVCYPREAQGGFFGRSLANQKDDFGPLLPKYTHVERDRSDLTVGGGWRRGTQSEADVKRSVPGFPVRRTRECKPRWAVSFSLTRAGRRDAVHGFAPWENSPASSCHHVIFGGMTVPLAGFLHNP